MKLTYSFSDDDLREVSTLLPFRISRTYLSLAVLLLCMYGLMLAQRPNWWTIPYRSDDSSFLLIAGAGIIVLPILIRAKIRSTYRHRISAALLGSVEITITEVNSVFKTANAEVAKDWALFESQKESDNFIVLYGRDGGLRPFPKRAFTPEQLMDFRILIGNRLGHS